MSIWKAFSNMFSEQDTKIKSTDINLLTKDEVFLVESLRSEKLDYFEKFLKKGYVPSEVMLNIIENDVLKFFQSFSNLKEDNNFNYILLRRENIKEKYSENIRNVFVFKVLKYGLFSSDLFKELTSEKMLNNLPSRNGNLTKKDVGIIDQIIYYINSGLGREKRVSLYTDYMSDLGVDVSNLMNINGKINNYLLKNNSDEKVFFKNMNCILNIPIRKFELLINNDSSYKDESWEVSALKANVFLKMDKEKLLKFYVQNNLFKEVYTQLRKRQEIDPLKIFNENINKKNALKYLSAIVYVYDKLDVEKILDKKSIKVLKSLDINKAFANEVLQLENKLWEEKANKALFDIQEKNVTSHLMSKDTSALIKMMDIPDVIKKEIETIHKDIDNYKSRTKNGEYISILKNSENQLLEMIHFYIETQDMESQKKVIEIFQKNLHNIGLAITSVIESINLEQVNTLKRSKPNL